MMLFLAFVPRVFAGVVWVSGFGFQVLSIGFWVLGFGVIWFWVLDFWVIGLLGLGFWVLGLGFWV